MTIMELLEQMANNTHHKIAADKLINEQPDEVRQAFLTNDTVLLKKQLGDVKHLADKNMVFQV